MGLTVSRKIGNAVVRNSVKRKIREYFRRSKHLIPHLDLVVVARPGSGKLPGRAIQEELSAIIVSQTEKSPPGPEGKPE